MADGHRRGGDHRPRRDRAWLHGPSRRADRHGLTRPRRRGRRRVRAHRCRRARARGDESAAADPRGRRARARQTRPHRRRAGEARTVLAQLRLVQGKVPLPMNRTHAGTLRKEHVGQTITFAGWVQKQRDFGELIFIDVRDRSGICQVVFDRERGASADVIAVAKEVRSEFVLRIEGEVVERAEGQKNAKLPTGDIEVVARSIEILNRSETPPFQIEEESDAADELRLEYRYLDLRRPPLTRNLVLRHNMLNGVRNYFDREGFIEIETPILTKSTSEGARDYLVPSRVHKGQFFALPQSPQIFKQLCMVAGLERYFQIARCFRDEDLRRDRQPEFTQIDVEASFIDEEFIYATIEGLFAEIFPLANIPVKTPFPRMTWQDAMDRYGIDKPDTRFGMELVDITAIAHSMAFEPFRAAQTVRAIVVPGGSS